MHTIKRFGINFALLCRVENHRKRFQVSSHTVRDEKEIENARNILLSECSSVAIKHSKSFREDFGNKNKEIVVQNKSTKQYKRSDFRLLSVNY